MPAKIKAGLFVAPDAIVSGIHIDRAEFIEGPAGSRAFSVSFTAAGTAILNEALLDWDGYLVLSTSGVQMAVVLMGLMKSIPSISFQYLPSDQIDASLEKLVRMKGSPGR